MRISDWSSDVCSSDLAEALRNRSRLYVAVVIFACPDELAAPLERGSDHVIDQAMLIFRTSCIEFRLEFALENLLEQVLEPAIIGFQNRSLGGRIQRPFAIQRVIHRCAGEIANRLVQIVQRHCNARGRSEEHTSELQTLMRNSLTVFH